MLNPSAVVSLGLVLITIAAGDHASAGAKPMPAIAGPGSSSALVPDIGPAGASAAMSPGAGHLTGAKTCRKFLPNVGMDMLVPCGEPPAATLKSEVPPVAHGHSGAPAPSRSARTDSRSERDVRKVSRWECGQILERMQLDGARENDAQRLRQGCR